MHITTTVLNLKKWQGNFIVVLYNIKIRYTILFEPNKITRTHFEEVFKINLFLAKLVVSCYMNIN